MSNPGSRCASFCEVVIPRFLPSSSGFAFRRSRGEDSAPIGADVRCSGALAGGTPLAEAMHMTRPLVCLVSAAALFGGACTSTHHIPRPVSVPELAARAAADAAGDHSVAIIYPVIRRV